MADVRWGAPTSWADAFAAANFQSLANNGGIINSGSPIDNDTTPHTYARLSFVCVTSTWAVSAGGHIAFYLLPLPHTGSNYPNSNNGNTAGDYPGGHQWVANIAFRTGTMAHIGVSQPFLIPRSSFQMYAVNRTGAALPNSNTNMTCQIQRFSEAIS